MVELNVGIEWLRSGCIVCVVSLHCLRPYFVAEKDPWPWEDALRVVMDCATPSFFFMSGYLLPRRGDLGKLQKRIVRIVLPFLVASLLKFALEFFYGKCRRLFWDELLYALRLTHLGADPFPEFCLLHEKLEAFGFRYDDETSLFEWARRAFVGSAFGHYYFVPVLVQLQVLAHLAVQQSDRVLGLLTAFSALWHPVRNYVVAFFEITASYAWRLPFIWYFYFLAGFYTRHLLIPDDDHKKFTGNSIEFARPRLGRRFGVVAAFTAFVGAACAAVSSTAVQPLVWRRIGMFFKDLYVVALPIAVCIAGSHASPPDQSGSILRRGIAVLRSELARFSYTIYLYHGFFLDRPWLPTTPWNVLAATVAFCYLVELLAKPVITSKFFGISPRTP